MICIIKIENNDITGWLIGTDTHDLRRQAQNGAWQDADLHNLARDLYQIEFPPPGKHLLSSGFVMLVD